MLVLSSWLDPCCPLGIFNEILSAVPPYLYCKLGIPLLVLSNNVIENTSDF